MKIKKKMINELKEDLWILENINANNQLQAKIQIIKKQIANLEKSQVKHFVIKKK